MSQFLSLDQEVNLQWVWRTLKIYFRSHSLPFTNIFSLLLMKVVLAIKRWRGPGLESSTGHRGENRGCTQHPRGSQSHRAHCLSFPISSFINSTFVLIMTWQDNFGVDYHVGWLVKSTNSLWKLSKASLPFTDSEFIRMSLLEVSC